MVDQMQNVVWSEKNSIFGDFRIQYGEPKFVHHVRSAVLNFWIPVQIRNKQTQKAPEYTSLRQKLEIEFVISDPKNPIKHIAILMPIIGLPKLHLIRKNAKFWILLIYQ